MNESMNEKKNKRRKNCNDVDDGNSNCTTKPKQKYRTTKCKTNHFFFVNDDDDGVYNTKWEASGRCK